MASRETPGEKAGSRPGAQLTRRRKLGVAAVVLVLHLGVLAALIHAFTPDVANQAVRAVTQVFDVPVQPPQPVPRVAPQPRPSPRAAAPLAEGSKGSPGKTAKPREVAVPPAKIVLDPHPAPPVVGTGADNASGARADGDGTGAAGVGGGTGSGSAGAGGGGGGGITATKPVKIAGDISSASDYPRESRKARIGRQVIISLRVGVDGRVKSCRIVQPSPDPQADRITCGLAEQRFVFRPARDASGQAVEADFGWRQRWFYRGR